MIQDFKAEFEKLWKNFKKQRLTVERAKQIIKEKKEQELRERKRKQKEREEEEEEDEEDEEHDDSEEI